MAKSRRTKRAARQPADLAYGSQSAEPASDVLSTNSTNERVGLDARIAGWVVEHSRSVLRTCYYTLQNRYDADDAAQLTFERALRHLRKHPGKVIRNPRAWLKTIATRLALRLREKVAKRQQMFGGELTREPEAPMETMLDQELANQLWEAAAEKLTDAQLCALRLRSEGKSYANIAKKMDQSGSAVRQLIYRARKQLKDALKLAKGAP